jgi:MoaA/NifB/PqqE/SkfB family radical SAM enzyme
MKFSTIFYVILANIKIWYLKFLNKHKSIVPYKILLNLTDLCNSRCIYCEIWKIKPKNEINMNEIGKMFDSLNYSLIWLSLSGGEVTLVNYYYDLIDQAVAKCKNLKILAFTTNALSPDKALKYAKYAKDKGLDVLITISLDGDEATHDQLRGIKGNYHKCEKLFSALKKENINVTYGITVSDQNKNFIENKYAIYREKIRAVTFVHSEGIYKIKNELSDLALLTSMKVIYKNYFIKNIQEIIEKIHIKVSIMFLGKNRTKNIIPCEVLNTSAHIMPSGEVKPCMFMSSLGNIKSEGFLEIYQSDKTNKVREEIKKNNCPKCWMNCYSPHSIMQNPVKSLIKFLNL